MRSRGPLHRRLDQTLQTISSNPHTKRPSSLTASLAFRPLKSYVAVSFQRAHVSCHSCLLSVATKPLYVTLLDPPMSHQTWPVATPLTVRTCLVRLTRSFGTPRTPLSSANVPSDLASRNAHHCAYMSCQTCSFVRQAEDSVVQHTSIL